MKFAPAFLLIISFFCQSCKFNPNFQGTGSDYLQGIWAEKNVAYQEQLLEYTSHEFKFSCDSFYVTFNTVAKTNIYPDSCFNKGRWTEYAKGIYITRNDTLFLSGTFTKANFKQKISGCYRIGQYLETFIVKRTTPDSLYLESLQQHLPVTLAIKEKITCTPKPL